MRLILTLLAWTYPMFWFTASALLSGISAGHALEQHREWIGFQWTPIGAILIAGELPFGEIRWLSVSLVLVLCLAAWRIIKVTRQKRGWRFCLQGLAGSALIVAAVWMPRPPAVIAAAPAAAYPKIFFQRGVNFTAEFPDGYRSEQSHRLLDQLKEHGVNAIALVPYGFERGSSPTVRFGHADESDESVAATAAYAHQIGLRVMLKPQVWTHGPGVNFPGDIQFTDPKDLAEWFSTYRLFVEHYAALAATIHADIFVVGTEFAKMTKHDAEWRKLIARVRELYPGPITYAAVQGPEFESITFWDALDYIGLNNYYPIPDSMDGREVVAKVEAVQKRFQKPVIFPEAGFTAYEKPNRAPWDETRRKLSLEDQARCYEALLQAFYKKPWFQGIYWWKVGSNGAGGPNDGSFMPWRKPAMEVVKRWYREGGR